MGNWCDETQLVFHRINLVFHRTDGKIHRFCVNDYNVKKKKKCDHDLEEGNKSTFDEVFLNVCEHVRKKMERLTCSQFAGGLLSEIKYACGGSELSPEGEETSPGRFLSIPERLPHAWVAWCCVSLFVLLLRQKIRVSEEIRGRGSGSHDDGVIKRSESWGWSGGWMIGHPKKHRCSHSKDQHRACNWPHH